MHHEIMIAEQAPVSGVPFLTQSLVTLVCVTHTCAVPAQILFLGWSVLNNVSEVTMETYLCVYPAVSAMAHPLGPVTRTQGLFRELCWGRVMARWRPWGDAVA